jgi:hypothetical protein
VKHDGELVLGAQLVERGLEGRQRVVDGAEHRETAGDDALPEDVARVRRRGEEGREPPAAVRELEVVKEPLPLQRRVRRVPPVRVLSMPRSWRWGGPAQSSPPTSPADATRRSSIRQGAAAMAGALETGVWLCGGVWPWAEGEGYLYTRRVGDKGAPWLEQQGWGEQSRARRLGFLCVERPYATPAHRTAKSYQLVRLITMYSIMY